MEMSSKDYGEYVRRRAKKSPLGKDMLLAFLIGGSICTLGQAITEAAMAAGLERADASTVTTIALIGLSVLLTGLNWYNKLARYGGAGTLVPITGFANAVASPAIDFKSESLVCGSCTKMFAIAGPVIVWGVAASAVYGLLLVLTGG